MLSGFELDDRKAEKIEAEFGLRLKIFVGRLSETGYLVYSPMEFLGAETLSETLDDDTETGINWVPQWVSLGSQYRGHTTTT